jgi:hypothetical protein
MNVIKLIVHCCVLGLLMIINFQKIWQLDRMLCIHIIIHSIRTNFISQIGLNDFMELLDTLQVKWDVEKLINYCEK